MEPLDNLQQLGKEMRSLHDHFAAVTEPVRLAAEQPGYPVANNGYRYIPQA